MQKMERNCISENFIKQMLCFYFDFQITKGKFKMSSLSFHVLFRIYMSADGMLSVNELTEKMQISKPQLVKLINNLEEENLVIRKRYKENRRIVYLSLSMDGFSLMEKNLENMEISFLEKLYTNDTSQAEHLTEGMKQIADAMNHYTSKTPE